MPRTISARVVTSRRAGGAALRVLEIGGTGRDFPMARVASVATLETLRLNGVRAEIDCAVFRELPELVELNVLDIDCS